jgi:hypothetical protein
MLIDVADAAQLGSPAPCSKKGPKNAWSVGLTVPEPGTVSLLAIGSLVIAGLAELEKNQEAFHGQ